MQLCVVESPINPFQSNSDNLLDFTHRENGLDLAKNVAGIRYPSPF